MLGIVLPIIALTIQFSADTAPASVETIGENLSRAETEMRQLLDKLHATLDEDQITKLADAQNSWESYRVDLCDFFKGIEQAKK